MRPRLWITIVLMLIPLACGYEKPNGQVSFITIDADPDWSPDGGLIAFASSRWLGGICLIRPDGKELRQLFRGVASNVDWSPDGRWIAFEGDHGIYTVRRNGGRPTLILHGAVFSLPTWAPDGRALAIVKEERDLSTAIYVARRDGSGLRRLFPSSDPKVSSTAEAIDASETEPAWSPDGNRIAFQAGNGRIVVATVDGRSRQIVANGYEPAWSPDGRLIAFQSESALWVTKADGTGGNHLLASNGGDPSWAPRSPTLVFEVRHWYGRYWRRPQSLSIVDEADTRLRKLTFGESVLDDTAWRGDRATP
jgi:Tol biopolymer transport system component